MPNCVTAKGRDEEFLRLKAQLETLYYRLLD